MQIESDECDDYSLVSGKCPYCNAHLVFKNNGIVLTSYPQQYQYTCKRCGHVWSAHNDEEAVKKEDSPMHSAEWTNKDSLTPDWSILGGPKIGDVPDNQNWGWGQQGWVCPKCGRVNAPWKGTCDCYKDTNTVTTDKIEVKPYWEYMPKTVSADFDNYKQVLDNTNTKLTEEEKQRLMKLSTCSTFSGSAKNITAHQ